MKNKIFTFFLLCIASQGLYAQKKISTFVTEYDLGAWALKQHNEICAKFHPAIKSGKIVAFNPEHKAMDKQEALKILETSYTAFVATDPDDPTKGYDTTVWSPAVHNFYGFNLSGADLIVNATKNGKPVHINRSQFYSLLTAENLLYLEKYTQNNRVLLEQIPLISQRIIISINVKLHTEGLKPGTSLFKSDSLTSTYNTEEKRWRGGKEIIAFISTDPNDPTIGMDTVYMEELNIADTAVSHSICFLLKEEKLQMQIVAVSCGLWFKSYYQPEATLEPFGFLTYSGILPLLKEDKTLLENCLEFCIKDKLQSKRQDYDYYMRVFNLKVKN